MNALAPIVPNACWVAVVLERHGVRNPREHAKAFTRAGYSAADVANTLARRQLKSSPIGPLLYERMNQMQLSGPNPVTFVAPQSQVVVDSVTFDLNQHRFVLSYRDNGGLTQKTVQGAIPPALLTALEAQVQKAIETNEGWGAGTSTVNAP